MSERVSTWSLRARLLLIAVFALFASLLFGGLAMYWAASIEENQMLDARLEHLGATVLSFVEEELSVLDADDPIRQRATEDAPDRGAAVPLPGLGARRRVAVAQP